MAAEVSPASASREGSMAALDESFSGPQRETARPAPGRDGSAGHSVQIDRVTHRYGGVTAVRDVSLDIRPGEFVALLGPSGCGKTTLLRIIAGFVTPTSGQICVDGVPVTEIPPNRRGVGIVFQNYALFPHMTVEQNVAYGLEARGAPRARVAEIVGSMIDLVHLGAMRKRYPRELSGGQQQRVALARALAIEPTILLLDEPFGALDKNLRLDMQIEIRRLQRQLGITCILVTHDQEEAMSMSDRIAVMQQGALEQFATPIEIYDRPATMFVNSFVGTANLLRGRVAAAADGRCAFEIDGAGALRVPDRGAAVAPGGTAVLSVRPENFRVADDAEPALRGTVRIALPLGAVTVYEVELADGQLVKVTEARHLESRVLPAGAPVALGLVAASATSFFAGAPG
jgi:putative spermidine/putrescine transport system ATP-binding protein